ncbi:MAG: phosphate/phosphite/phosphonate ABC transporter substrate-binding protein [Thermodesulfobacteriota bacterium]
MRVPARFSTLFRHVTACLLALLPTIGLILPAQAHHRPQPIRLAITPCTEVVKTFKHYQPLAVYLGRHLQRPVELIIPKDFKEFEKIIQNGEAEFAFQAPHTYVRLASHYNRDFLLQALTPDGKTSHHGVIIVRKDSPIKRVEDLKGKQFLFGAENDMAKALAARLLLARHGIQTKDLGGYKYDGSCESIALNVFLKTMDAGAICDYSYDEINEGKGEESDVPAGKLRVLAETDEVPSWVFSARQGVDQELLIKTRKALTALGKDKKEHHRILEGAEISGFVDAKDDDYNEVRKVVGPGSAPP